LLLFSPEDKFPCDVNRRGRGCDEIIVLTTEWDRLWYGIFIA